MELFGMGVMELVMVLVMVLIVFGPGRIVDFGKTLGRIARTLRKTSFDLTAAVSKEMKEQEQEKPPESTRNNTHDS